MNSMEPIYVGNETMKLELHKPELGISRRLDSLRCLTKPCLEQSPQEFQASSWVQLLEPLSPFTFDEALLVCQHSEDQWLAWIPDYGQAIIHASQFCRRR